MINNIPPKPEKKECHIWDGDLYELRNPVPKWWMYSYLTTILIAIIYWIMYPAWPGIKSYSKGILNWSSTSEFKTAQIESNKNKKKYFDMVSSHDLNELMHNEELRPFIISFGKYAFKTRCQRCHGTSANGIKGKFPSLVDSEWIHGNKLKDIFKTIKEGQKNMMPKHTDKLNNDEILNVSEYVYSLSNSVFNKEMALKGAEIFESEDGDCYDCHGDNADGDFEIGAPNLTNNIWLYGGKREDIIEIVKYGKKGIMPSWKEKFSDTQIKIITVYIKLLSEKHI